MAEVDGGRENTGLIVTIFIDRVSHFDGMDVIQDLGIAESPISDRAKVSF